MQNKKENDFINVLRGVAIVLVLYAHSVQYGSGEAFLQSGEYWDNLAMKVIYSFHMPLFMSISGYLFWNSVEKKGLLNSVKKRFSKFIPIVLCWAFVLSGWDLVVGKPISIKHFIAYFLTDFWFLWAIMVCSFGVLLLEKLRGGYRILLIVSLFPLCLFAPDYYGLGVYKFMFPYYVAGYFVNKKDALIFDNFLLGIFSLASWLVLLLLYSKDTYVYTTGLSLLGKDSWVKQVFIDMYRYIIGFLGTFSTIYWLKRLYCMYLRSNNIFLKSVIRSFAFLGRRTLPLYILSTYIFDRILPAVTKEYTLNYFVTFIETLVVGLLCLSLARIIQLSKPLSKVMIGG